MTSHPARKIDASRLPVVRFGMHVVSLLFLKQCHGIFLDDSDTKKSTCREP